MGGRPRSRSRSKRTPNRKGWYVVAREPEEYQRIDVFGPFRSKVDAEAYTMDLAEDNGWEEITVEYIEHRLAEKLATDRVYWPYEEEE